MDNFNLIMNMSKFTLFLHKNIYISSTHIDTLKNCLCSQFEVSSISFTYNPLRFELKLKKIDIKKEKNYSGASKSCSYKIANAFNMFFSDNSVISDIKGYIEDIDDPFEYEIIDTIFERILNPVGDFKPVELLYYTTFVDNMIFINI